MYPLDRGRIFTTGLTLKGVAFSIEFVSSKSNQHQFSPNGYENFLLYLREGMDFSLENLYVDIEA